LKQKSDGELVSLTRSGQKRAFGQLITRHLPLARQVATAMVGNGDIAQELAQEALLQAYLSLDHLREPERFRNWLCGIVLNVCRSHLREQQAGRDLLAALPRSAAPDAWVLAERRERQDLVREAIRALSPENRAAVELFYDEQRSLQEVAAALRISVAAVKGRLHKARRQLRAQLLPLYPDLAAVLPRKQRRKRMVKVTVSGVYVYAQQEEPVRHFLRLTDEAGRHMRIWIGQGEAVSISYVLAKTPAERPMTLDFMANLLREMGASLEEVRIETLKNETFYAVVKLNVAGQSRTMDARPSDAIALAVRTDSPIFVADDIVRAMEEADATPPADEAQPLSLVSVEDAAGLAAGIIQRAIQEKASEITFGIGPGQAGVHVLYKIAGVLHDKMTLPRQSLEPLVARFKVMADMDLSHPETAQKGHWPAPNMRATR